MTLDNDAVASAQHSPAPELPPTPASTPAAEPHSPKPPPEPSSTRRTKPPTRDELGSNQELTIIGKLLNPIQISFSQNRERMRAFSTTLPRQLYRTFHEESKTLCAFMKTENQPKHREAEGVKILLRNAFQAIDWAIRRAEFHTNESTKIGHRISIAAISTNGLTPATVHAQYESTYNIITRHGRGRSKEIETYVQVDQVALPVWIRQSAVPADRSPITPRQLRGSGADLWVSITELRHSDLKNVAQGLGIYGEILKKGHDYEWLCLGAIDKSHITCIMPWDGNALHSSEKTRIIWSKSSPEQYVFDWKLRQWRLDPKLFALAVFRHRKAELAKRGARNKQLELKARKKRGSKLQLKKSGKTSNQEVDSPLKRKRKHTVDGDGNDLVCKASKVPRTNADVWDMMIKAQKDDCQCRDRRHTRAGSANL